MKLCTHKYELYKESDKESFYHKAYKDNQKAEKEKDLLYQGKSLQIRW